MLEKIIRLLPDYCGDMDDINEKTTLSGDIGMSSLDFFLFINNVEEEFDIKITENEMHNLLTIGDVLRCIEGKKA